MVWWGAPTNFPTQGKIRLFPIFHNQTTNMLYDSFYIIAFCPISSSHVYVAGRCLVPFIAQKDEYSLVEKMLSSNFRAWKKGRFWRKQSQKVARHTLGAIELQKIERSRRVFEFY